MYAVRSIDSSSCKLRKFLGENVTIGMKAIKHRQEEENKIPRFQGRSRGEGTKEKDPSEGL